MSPAWRRRLHNLCGQPIPFELKLLQCFGFVLTGKRSGRVSAVLLRVNESNYVEIRYE